MANFSHVENGKMYYKVQLESGLYIFPLCMEEKKTVTVTVGEDIVTSFDIMVPASDMKGASFGLEVRGSELNRWIDKAIKTDDFVKIG